MSAQSKGLAEWPGELLAPPNVTGIPVIKTFCCCPGKLLSGRNVACPVRYRQAADDSPIIAARSDAAGALWFGTLLRPSRHSTVRLLFGGESAGEVPCVRCILRERGCGSELSDLPALVAVDIPPAVAYAALREFFEEGEAAGLFEYEEGCLGWL